DCAASVRSSRLRDDRLYPAIPHMVVDPSEDPRTRTSGAPSFFSDDPSWWKLGSVFGRFVAVPRSRVDGALKPHPREADTAGDGAAAASRLSVSASGARAHARARGGG